MVRGKGRGEGGGGLRDEMERGRGEGKGGRRKGGPELGGGENAVLVEVEEVVEEALHLRIRGLERGNQEDIDSMREKNEAGGKSP